ncbi:tRNA (adenosine(37)-N6)-dimethylallyltransferase MiaA [Azotosporobacter soli]|uniref:tRNA (adenosine(37)-N6)-dimethylallyltransferase MiaA n=1 Tax=Azotosporobacter soli TaxID=3055040 RepID=UPI0031FF17C2
MNKLVVIAGPTAVGKTQLGIDIALQCGGEIISGDSMLVYRGMDIGTAKPSLVERKGVPHHLIDIIEPGATFSAVDFQQAAEKLIFDIQTRGKTPIIVGGTGLYLKALLEGYTFVAAESNAAYRKEMEGVAEEKGSQYLYERLRCVDPAAAERIHPNNVRRMIRALEVAELGGETIPETQVLAADQLLRYDAVVVGITMERALLHQRINGRVDSMVEAGVLAEVEELLRRGIERDSQCMQGIGYKEFVAHLAGECSLPEAVENVKAHTRQFAKRQWTWFRKMPYLHWLEYQPKKGYASLLESFYQTFAGNYL